MANGSTYNRRNIALGVIAAIVVLLVIAWLAGAFQGTPEQPTTQAPETETTTPEPETTVPEAEEPAQQQ
jgi:predicted Zn-dependent peptidase